MGCEKSEKSYEASQRWRAENDIDHLLERPHPLFREFKEILFHKIIGHDALGNIVVVERTGSLREKTNALRAVELRQMISPTTPFTAQSITCAYPHGNV